LVGLAHQIQNQKHRVQPLWFPARAGGPVRWDEREVRRGKREEIEAVRLEAVGMVYQK